jgi:protein involved in temperature-dependent protein secretion
MPLRILPLPIRKGTSMPQTCTVCRHKNVSEINLALVSGEPLRSIAGRTSLAKSSLQRHKENCIPRDIIQARQFGKIADADMLLGQVCNLLANFIICYRMLPMQSPSGQ